jgi:hypothetical protein
MADLPSTLRRLVVLQRLVDYFLGPGLNGCAVIPLASIGAGRPGSRVDRTVTGCPVLIVRVPVCLSLRRKLAPRLGSQDRRTHSPPHLLGRASLLGGSPGDLGSQLPF